jgi:hypothetical protein
MIITVPSEKKYTKADILNINLLFGNLTAVNDNYRNGIILLHSETGEELPFYLRSEVAGCLKSLHDKAIEWNTAIIIPDIVQKQLFQSKRLYPQRLEHLYPHIRPQDKLNTTEPEVQAAEGKLGFLEKEKLLLLELLLGEHKWHLERIVHTLREHKVFCLKLGGEVGPDRHYIIVKFDSTTAINNEYANFDEIRRLFIDAGKFEQYDVWRDKIYILDAPKGQERDLFKIISSTVKTVGAVEDWTSQTLKGSWSDKAREGIIGTIIDNVFSTLGELYSLGYGKQGQPNPRERGIAEIYRDFYKQHIMPIDCVLKCSLSDIVQTSADADVTVDEDVIYPPAIGSNFEGHDYRIEEIKLRDNKRKTPIVSLIAKNKQRLVELNLGPLGAFSQRREFYIKEIKDGARINFKGRVEDNFENSLRVSMQDDLELYGGEFGTERVIPETEDLRRPQIKFVDGELHANPLYFYSQIYSDPVSSAASLKITSLSTYIHGDLNVGNIITTPSGEVRIIDFARLVKDGPLEFDFAELEIDIRIRNLVEECGKMHDPLDTKDTPKYEPKSLETIVKDLFKFEETLLEVFDDRASEEDLVCKVSASFQPGFLAITKIRKKLLQTYRDLSDNVVSAPSVLKAYMTAIYFESLAALNFGSDPLAKTWALVAATVACENLFGSIEKTSHMTA